jgi:hypothetical protein
MAPLLSLVSAAGELRAETEHARRVADGAIANLRSLAEPLGSVASAASHLGVSRQYLGRVLRGDRPMTEKLVRKIQLLR